MKKRYTVMIAVALMCISVGAYAASNVVSSWTSHTYKTDSYETLPTAGQCTADIGYAPSLTEEFANGYTFKSAHIVANDLKDENNNSIEKFKSLDVAYAKDGNEVTLNAEKYNSDIASDGDVVKSIDGVDLYYYEYMNKMVPADYKMTEEDKSAEKNGDLVFSYGADDISIQKVKMLRWENDDIHYNLMQFDGELTENDLAAMATELL